MVLRDLSVRTPVLVRAMGPDGVLLEDGTHVPWFDVLVGQNWQATTPAEPQPLANRDIQAWQQAFGQPWFLIRSRLARGESFQVDELLEQLAQSYAARDLPSVGAVAVGYFRSRQLQQAGDPTAAALEWLAAQLAWSQLPQAPPPGVTVDWQSRLQQYADPSEFRVDSLLGVPFHGPPAIHRWTDAERNQWLALWRQAQESPDPGTSSRQQIKILLAVYGLTAATQHSDPTTLSECLGGMENLSKAMRGAPLEPLLNHFAQIGRRVRRCQEDPTQWQAADSFRDYLILEQEWLRHSPAEDRSKRQRIVWETYLQGLALRCHADPIAQETGRLHLWLLRHWTERHPDLAAEIPLLQSIVWEPLLTR